ncbi:DUF4056 domain-containing protein [Photobacterium damselae]|uniref:DUF4056 domain-containing protein n=1 Tax=Photobacterium damselae TaxID=38293 RepID=UPI001F1AE695|nr:DUF4056 domain-containing protein [Photobacterium damselae]UKA12130.1 DUF4056 domain-containing protein [Photobacterium damselae subsp. damselae]
MIKLIKPILGAGLLLFIGSVNAMDAPVGVRPCCAFGKDLKAEVGGVPVPFFSIGNILGIEDLGSHVYNDGSQGVSSSLLGMGKETNGIVYTQKGGFIDIAHVRDTADFTFYLYQEIHSKLGSGTSIVLTPELRSRHVYLPKKDTHGLTAQERQQISVELAGLMAFRLAQWHEIAQWFGLESVGGFSELASAFSPEDLYSNMLGAKVAMNILQQQPSISKQTFSQIFTQNLKAKLIALDIVSADKAKQKMASLDGQWWDSSKRLPQKWVVLKRDYRLRLDLQPNGIANGELEQLTAQLSNGDNSEQWADLYLHSADREKQFELLPAELKKKQVWQPKDFNQLANFAKQHDAKEVGHSTQV